VRLGIFSDVHANIEALSAVVEALRRESPDVMYCLGDVVGYGASPNECADLVRSVAKVTILGNHDAAVAGRMDYSYYYEAARRALDLHVSLLTRGEPLVAPGAPVQARRRGHRRPPLPRLAACGSRSSTTSSRPSRRATASPSSPSSGTSRSSGTRTCARPSSSRSDDVIELQGPPNQLRPAPRPQVHRVGRAASGSPATTTTAPATCSTTPTRSASSSRVEYDIEGAAQKIFDARLERNFGHRLFIGV
jgi:hypothetical protein